MSERDGTVMGPGLKEADQTSSGRSIGFSRGFQSPEGPAHILTVEVIIIGMDWMKEGLVLVSRVQSAGQ